MTTPQTDPNGVASELDDVISDPRTKGFSFAAVGPNNGSISMSITDGDYETHVCLAAIVLGEHLGGLEVDSTEFVKDVVNELNDRDFIETHKSEYPATTDDA